MSITKLKNVETGGLNKMIYYPIEFKFKIAQYIYLWFEDINGENHFYKFQNKIMSFNDNCDVIKFGVLNNLKISSESLIINVRELVKSDSIDCDLCLDFWNSISDLANEDNISFLGNNRDDNIDSLYMRLYENSNVSVLTKNHKESTFSNDEIELLNSIIQSGIEVINKINGFDCK